MPRGKKSKLQDSKKRRQARGKPQNCGKAQGTAAAEEECTPSSSLQCAGVTQSLPAAESGRTSQEPPNTPFATTPSAGISCPRCDEASYREDEDKAVSSKAPLDTHSEMGDFTNRAGCLEFFLLVKYRMKQPILKEDMLRFVGENLQDRFVEMLKNASEKLEATFALELNEVDSTVHSYALVSKVKLPNNGRVRAGRGFPKTGLLMSILGFIFMKGNCVPEEEIWAQLSRMQVYAGRKHFFFGEPRKLITKDFVRLQYLEYHQVPDSDPPCYEFLWGAKAHVEISKMEVLKFWTKVIGTHPRAYPCCYEEALRDEEERARSRHAARLATTAQVSVPPRAMASTIWPPLEKSEPFFPPDQNI